MRIAALYSLWPECHPRLVFAMPLMLVLLPIVAGCSAIRQTSSQPDESTEPVSAAQEQLIARGRSQFLHCNSSHVVDTPAPPPKGDSLGPHLEGIVARPSGSVDGFEYTEELQARGLVWDEDTLDQWLQQPRALVPAMCEPFKGISKPQQRSALIAFLNNPPAR